MAISMELLNQLKLELEQERKKSNKYEQVLNMIADGYDKKSNPPKVLSSEDKSELALKAISPTN